MTAAPTGEIAPAPGVAPAPALTDAERELGARLDRALGRLVRWNARRSPGPFAPGVLSALGTVVDYGPIRLGDLAAREGVAPASLTRLLGVLEGAALVARSTDPLDRRSAFVTASQAGRALIEERRHERGEALAGRLAPLDAPQLAALLALVDAIEEVSAG